MTHKEKDILATFSELNSMLYELLNDYNKALDDIVKLKTDIDWFKKYTDKLVEHKDMVCLPADLKNLRESNAVLATENQELKKQVDTLNEVITQAWFTDVEEKDKQIRYLLKKVKELSDPELKDDEEVTKTFMDKQTNPKDIEFDVEAFVKGVKDYADSLQNNNEPKLKSLKGHNNGTIEDKIFDAYGGNSVKSGIACPKCGSEMYYPNPNTLLTCYPPKRSVECKNCKHTDYVNCITF